ncbi:F-box/LRR-repeat protein 7 [Nematostella vectensis]|nr:F-box/LRR-repeat protein 7 [Nematostella vectensis]
MGLKLSLNRNVLSSKLPRCISRTNGENNGEHSKTFNTVFSDIPDTVLLLILSHLNTQDRAHASMVCRRWNRVCRDATLWRMLDFSANGVPRKTKLRDRHIIRLISRNRRSHVGHIDLSGPCCKNITNFTLFYVGQNCLRLRTLNISNCSRVTDTALEVVIKHCVEIEELDIGKCSAVTGAGVMLAVRKLRQLARLDVSGVTMVTDMVLMYIGRFGRHLKYLNIEGSRKVTDMGLSSLSALRKTLRHLNLKNTKRITNNGISSLLSRLQKLEKLELGFTRKSLATIAVLNSVAQHCKQLTELDVKEWKESCDKDVMIQIANQNPGIRISCSGSDSSNRPAVITLRDW